MVGEWGENEGVRRGVSGLKVVHSEFSACDWSKCVNLSSIPQFLIREALTVAACTRHFV